MREKEGGEWEEEEGEEGKRAGEGVKGDGEGERLRNKEDDRRIKRGAGSFQTCMVTR